MGIRRKAVLAVVVTLLVMLGVGYLAADRMLDESLDDAERTSTIDALARVARVMDLEIESIGKTNFDWAAWDDTYEFVVDRNTDYLESNVPVETLKSFDLHSMVYIDASGEIAYGTAVAPDTGAEVPLPAGLAAVARSEAMQHDSIASVVEGIVTLDDGPAMITSYPILTSLREGPARGALVMSRFIDDVSIDRLSDATGYDVTISSVEAGLAASDAQVSEALTASNVAVHLGPDDLISGYSFVDDIAGEPILLLEVTRPMDLASRDGAALRYFAVASVLGAVLLGVVLTVFLDRSVLRRLVSLKNSATRFIAEEGPHGERFAVSGRDEISELETSLNEMLNVLERTESELRDATADVHARSEELAAVNTRLQTELDERMLLEGRLEVAEKLEALGVLAGGMAHDFNNLLAGVMLNASLLATKLEPGTAEYNHVMQLNYAAERASGLTSQLLTFARGGAPIRQPTDLEALVTEVASFALSGSDIAWSLDIDDDVSLVNVDAGQVSQVLNNLLINAMQAIGDDGGRIDVAAQRVLFTERDDGLGLLPDAYVLVAVSDTGPGIPPEHVDRIFDPYFSTKSDGSGLGLATAWSIARRHGGALVVASSNPAGTAMNLYLPAAEHGRDAEPARADVVRRRSARVLVMDDNELILETVEPLLEELGCRASVARHGREALDSYQRALDMDDPFDVVVLDLTIVDGMDGLETIAALQSMDPDVVAVVSSGYSNSPVVSDFAAYGFSAVLPKPFNLDRLAATLQEVLDADSGARV